MVVRYGMGAGSERALSGVVLAGGRSRRLGRDKAFLRLDGRPLVERIIDTVGQLASEVIVVANEISLYESFEARVVCDFYPDKGALGGIFSGLRAAIHQYALVVACDMPFLSLSLLRYMRDLTAGYDLVIPRMGELTESLHAIYSQSCLPAIERQLMDNDLRIAHLFPRLRVKYVELEEIDLFDPDHLSFFNINSQSDLEKAKAIWRRVQSEVPSG